MDGTYADYEYVVLDASSLMHELPEELLDHLAEYPALIAQTFDSECRAYLNLLPEWKRPLFFANQRKMDRKVRFTEMFREEQYIRRALNRDALGLLHLLSGISTRNVSEPRSCLLVTGDLSQIQQVAFNAIPADILYLPENRLFMAEDTKELKARFHYGEKHRNDKYLDVFPHGENPTAYDANGNPIQLKRVMDRRGSSRIYETPDGRYAKIFHEDRQTLNKMRHIMKLVQFHEQLRRENMDLDWLLLPTELLYMEMTDEDGAYLSPVGYLMNKANNTNVLKNVLRLKNMHVGGLLWKNNCSTPYEEYLHMAWMITHHAAYLKTYNLWPSDFNPENFSLCDPKNKKSTLPSHYKKLYMWDTDSICWNGYIDHSTSEGLEKHRYISDRWAPNLEPPMKDYKIEEESCANALYQCVFYILTMGKCPYGNNRRDPERFCFDRLSLEERDRFFFIPENLRRLFHDVFVCGNPPSVPCLLYELERARNEMHMTLEERYPMALGKALAGENFRPERKSRSLVLPATPEVPEVSVSLSRWLGNTVPFNGKRCRRIGLDQAEREV